MDDEKLTEQEALAMRERLARHYGSPVLPLAEYCAAFRVWAEELQARQRRRQGTDEEKYDAWVNSLGDVYRQISKSNLLWRLLYVGEKKRTRMCPEHKGEWFGLQGDTHDICLHGCDKTGWLPEDDDPIHERSRRFIAAFNQMQVMIGAEEALVCTRAAMEEVSSLYGKEPFSGEITPETTAAIAQLFAKRDLMLCSPSSRLINEDGTRKHARIRHIGYRSKEHTFEWVDAGRVYYLVGFDEDE